MKFKDESILTQSLKEMGYKVEIHDEGVNVGRGISANAHLVVRRNQFNGYGDVGFERTEKGFVMHADDYDAGIHGNKFRLGTLNKKYIENKLRRYVNTTSSINIFSRNENKNGQIEIQLSLM